MLDETTYYFSIFALDQNNTIIDVQSKNIQTDFFKQKFDRLDYISRNGNNYIDTERIPNLTTGYRFEIGYRIDSSGYRYIIASSYDGTNNNNGFEINSGSVSNNRLRYLIKGTTFEMFSSNSMSTGTFYDIVFESSGNSKKAILNGTTTSGTYSVSGSFGNSLYLFVDRSLRWNEFNHNSRCQYLRIYENNVLVKSWLDIK